jgi:CHAD domain-containing protein
MFRLMRAPLSIAPTHWIEHLARHVPIARAGVDSEGAHQIRVAAARLRIWLALGGWHVLSDDLRWLRRHAAHVRDLDVHLSRQPPPELAARLAAEHAQAQRELVAALDSDRTAGLLQALALLPAISPSQAAPGFVKLASTTLRRFRAAARDPDDVGRLHRARCALRRLRYALDWIAACPDEIVALQDELGEVGDRIAALRHIDAAGSTSTHAYRGQIEDELRTHARRAQHMWSKLEPACEEISRWTST